MSRILRRYQCHSLLQSVGTLSLRFFCKVLFSELWNKLIFPHLFMQVCYERPRFMTHHSSSLYIVCGKKSTCSKRIAKTGDGRCLKPVNSIRIWRNISKKSAVNCLSSWWFLFFFFFSFSKALQQIIILIISKLFQLN